MTDPEPPPHEGRLDTMLPGIPIAAKVALLAGLAGGLFAAIVMSYVDNTRQYHALATGVILGAIAALVLALRSMLRNRHS